MLKIEYGLERVTPKTAKNTNSAVDNFVDGQSLENH
jgi:hypothetical protein